jgi:hypothetical protein
VGWGGVGWGGVGWGGVGWGGVGWGGVGWGGVGWGMYALLAAQSVGHEAGDGYLGTTPGHQHLVR